MHETNLCDQQKLQVRYTIPVQVLKSKTFIIPAAVLTIWLVVFILYPSVHYSGRTLPNTSVAGLDLGSKNQTQIVSAINSSLADEQLTISRGNFSKSVSLQDAGLSANESEVTLIDDRSWTDLFKPWFLNRSYALSFSVDQEKLQEQLKELESDNFRRPLPANYQLRDAKLVINDGLDGFGFDVDQIASDLSVKMSSNLASLSVNVLAKDISPKINDSVLTQAKPEVESLLQKDIRLIADKKTFEPELKKVLSWIVVGLEGDQPILSLSEDKISEYVDELSNSLKREAKDELVRKFVSGAESVVDQAGVQGRRVNNKQAIVDQLLTLVDKLEIQVEIEFKKTNFQTVEELVDDTVTDTFTYEVAVWGSVNSNISEFKTQISETLQSSQGWRGAGVGFEQVDSDGDFTIVLAEPAEVDAISPGCDAVYSCRVGEFVIINDARWQGATTAWNNAGGSLRDYRHMVVNHETGHWLGFGHSDCPGPNQKAPIMQQQSIDLQGCKFNPWPLPIELNSL